MQMDGRMSKFWLPWLVGMPFETTVAVCSVLMGGVLHKFPKLKLCFAHGAGCYPSLKGRVEHGFNVRPDLCAQQCPQPPDQMCRNIYADSLVHDEKSLRMLIDSFGDDKIVLGTDYPFPLGEHEPGHLIETASFLDDRTKRKLLYENCANLLKLNDKLTF
uniref:2-amino-3-carboxymuconate-6-semialdehyde decarboxylase n=1 Tax=Romanomermis culicivorax TaxID=13658 RepID=A0A915L3L0_ROMCU